MSSWRPAGDDAEAFPAPSRGAGDQASNQQFPVPEVTHAIATYLPSRPQQANSRTRRPPAGADAFHPPPLPPGRHNHGLLQPWPPRRHQHHPAPAASSAHRFAPPAPSLNSSRTVRPNVMVPGEAPDSSPPTGGAADGSGGDAPVCLRVARRAGRRAAGEGRNFVLSPLSLHAALALVAAGANGHTRRELLGLLGYGSLAALQRAVATKLVGALRDLPQTSFACGVWVDRRWQLKPEFTGKLIASVPMASSTT